MQRTSYVMNGASLVIDDGACIGCGDCLDVCPHAVIAIDGQKAWVADRGACMECGACARNCPVFAITVKAGVGCAAAIIQGKLRGTAPNCDCDSGSGDCC